MDRRLMVLALGMFALGTDSFVIAGVLPQMARSFQVSVGAAGQMTTVYALAFALLAPIIAALAAGISRKGLLLAGLGVFVLANLGTAVAPTLGIALATRAFAGLGAAIFSPTATSSATVIVPRERIGYALAVVITGLTISTALGAPIGTMIGGFADWRWTMVFVAVLAALAALGVMAFLSHIPLLPAISLAKRLAPLADARVGLTLGTTFLFYTAAFTVYTYFAVVFQYAIGGNAAMLGGLLVLWGAAGMVSNVWAGRIIDRVGTRKILNVMLAVVLVDFLFLHSTSSHLGTATIAIFFWGACGWGTVVPLQHRLVGIAPPIAPLLLGLNNSAVYLGTTVAGIIGAAAMQMIGAQNIGYVAAFFVAAALGAAELGARKIDLFHRRAAVQAASLPDAAMASEHT
jgi:predicted MFS family arabinose efflux permease